MSVHFAIPATSFVLRAILEKRLKVAYGALTPPAVSVAPPPRPEPTPGTGAPPEPAGLYLYLHHAGPNAAFRNIFDPLMDSQGARVANAPLALDLQYMLAATGADLERELILGVGLSAFHRNGILPRPMIKAILDAVAVPTNPTKIMDRLTKEPLDERTSQPQQITISQQPVDLDLSTKIWSALQSPLRPCAFFMVTTVFLDAGDTPPARTPVDKLDIAIRPNANRAADPAGDDHVVVE